jgi:hypothetical protein
MERRESKSEKGRKRRIEREPSRKEIGGRVTLLGLWSFPSGSGEAGKDDEMRRMGTRSVHQQNGTLRTFWTQCENAKQGKSEKEGN